MQLRPGMRVLDVGCGVGGPAREIAVFSDVNVVGINNNDFQIGRAYRYTEKAGLSSRLEFVKGDFMTLSEQFGEGSFDAGKLRSSLDKLGATLTICPFQVYAIEATVHAPTWEGVYGEILKVLKPGGVVSYFSCPFHTGTDHEVCVVRCVRVVHDGCMGPLHPFPQRDCARDRSRRWYP
jgi:sterol 24-C-methyltransferase